MIPDLTLKSPPKHLDHCVSYHAIWQGVSLIASNVEDLPVSVKISSALKTSVVVLNAGLLRIAFFIGVALTIAFFGMPSNKHICIFTVLPFFCGAGGNVWRILAAIAALLHEWTGKMSRTMARRRTRRANHKVSLNNI